jgi:hypothetical protein
LRLPPPRKFVSFTAGRIETSAETQKRRPGFSGAPFL